MKSKKVNLIAPEAYAVTRFNVSAKVIPIHAPQSTVEEISKDAQLTSGLFHHPIPWEADKTTDHLDPRLQEHVTGYYIERCFKTKLIGTKFVLRDSCLQIRGQAIVRTEQFNDLTISRLKLQSSEWDTAKQFYEHLRFVYLLASLGVKNHTHILKSHSEIAVSLEKMYAFNHKANTILNLFKA